MSLSRYLRVHDRWPSDPRNGGAGRLGWRVNPLSLPESQERFVLLMHQLPEGAIARCARAPRGHKPGFPFALGRDDLGTEHIDGGIAQVADVERRLEVFQRREQRILPGAVDEVLLLRERCRSI